jgi:hypothetical protein
VRFLASSLRLFVSALLLAIALFGSLRESVSAAPITKVSWKVSSLTTGETVLLKNVATSNSKGIRKWSKSGSCTLSSKTLKMGNGPSCKLTVRISKFGIYPAKVSTKTISRRPTVTTTAPSTVTTTAPSTVTTTAPSTVTTTAPPEYRVGQTGPGGGTVFYVNKSRPVGSQYFEVACHGWQNQCNGSADPLVEWNCYNVRLDTDWYSIGTGERNTSKILEGCNGELIAARLADEYTNSGQSDWFLPSREELNALCLWAFNDTTNTICNNDGVDNRTMVQNFYSGWYLSSSTAPAANPYYSWAQRFTDGQRGNSWIRYNPAYVRPIRSF